MPPKPSYLPRFLSFVFLINCLHLGASCQPNKNKLSQKENSDSIKPRKESSQISENLEEEEFQVEEEILDERISKRKKTVYSHHFYFEERKNIWKAPNLIPVGAEVTVYSSCDFMVKYQDVVDTIAFVLGPHMPYWTTIRGEPGTYYEWSIARFPGSTCYHGMDVSVQSTLPLRKIE